MSEPIITIKPSQLEDIRIVLASILGRDPFITEVAEILEVIATFQADKEETTEGIQARRNTA